MTTWTIRLAQDQANTMVAQLAARVLNMARTTPAAPAVVADAVLPEVMGDA